METVGVPQGLHFHLQWNVPRAVGSAAEATRGTLALWIGRHLVWGRPTARAHVQGAPWTWVDLLEHLAQRWTALLWEELDPLGMGVPAWDVRAGAEKRWASLHDSAKKEREQRAVLKYEESHNLAAALAGATAPSLWVSREGLRIGLSAGRRQTIWRPVPEVVSTLVALGDAIAVRLDGLDDERARDAVADWGRREHQDLDRVVSVATSLPLATVRELAGDRPVADAWGVHPLSETPSELMVAARMLSSQAPLPVLRQVLDWIRSRRRLATPELDALSEPAARIAGETGKRLPFAIGRDVAQWLRSIPGIASRDRVDPDELLGNYGVEVEQKSLGWNEIDAVCCWGPANGPAILVNLEGVHARGPAGRRATLAHELCHLLLDRWQILPLAEVLGGRCPVHTEQRANAFAAELLIPGETVGRILSDRGDPIQLVEQVREAYGVGVEMIAWQAVRSAYGTRLSKKMTSYLRTLVKDTAQFDEAVSLKG